MRWSSGPHWQAQLLQAVGSAVPAAGSLRQSDHVSLYVSSSLQALGLQLLILDAAHH